MKFDVTIKLTVDTDDYSDVSSVEDVKELVEGMVECENDWPDEVFIEATPK